MSDTPWPHFSRKELECHCGCGQMEMDHELLDRLESLRTAFGKPMRVTSGFRCPTYNAQISGTGFTGPHTTGMAVDHHLQIAGALLMGRHRRDPGHVRPVPRTGRRRHRTAGRSCRHRFRFHG